MPILGTPSNRNKKSIHSQNDVYSNIHTSIRRMDNHRKNKFKVLWNMIIFLGLRLLEQNNRIRIDKDK